MTLHFRIQLAGITKPPVWRKLSVPAHLSFLALHEVIQAAFGWTNTHLFQFSEEGFGSVPAYTIPDPDDDFFEEGEQVDAEEVRLSEVFTREGQRYVYIYDFGDEWTHQMTLERISDEATDKPVLTAGKGACPPEDCGGAPGYAQLKGVLSDPADPEHEEMRDWLGLEPGEAWDPAAFDLKAAQEAVGQTI
jgi:hypothetical protein